MKDVERNTKGQEVEEMIVEEIIVDVTSCSANVNGSFDTID